ncbi:MAG TPA: bifunctional precorrin-2 dehydrogenase/sirohydrochlorin ferrochelatase [Candidatus Aquilonibacter sp.]|jgi:precorrin-2 dehydrogenase/sirohydrochlorin ferrochelatase|nr:bifunctional precorrin-2 dehydrogenase/sirohydrochlorin ferrochelatase [Candidatus Aquilonibacter sp.]
MSSLFPIFLKLDGKRCLVVGAGKVGEAKIAGLIQTGARVHVVALQASQAVHEWAKAGKIVLELRAYVPADFEGASLAVIATSNPQLNKSIYQEAQRRGILCNVVDVPEYCDFYYPAVVRRGDLQIAISTNGQSPSLAQKLRQQLERQFGLGYARWIAELGATRNLILASDLDAKRKSELLHSLASREALEAALREKTQKEVSKEDALKQEFVEDDRRVMV